MDGHESDFSSLLEGCRSSEASDRLAAVRSLRANPREEAREQLEAMARSDPERLVRMAAADVLETMGLRMASLPEVRAKALRSPVRRVVDIVGMLLDPIIMVIVELLNTMRRFRRF